MAPFISLRGGALGALINGGEIMNVKMMAYAGLSESKQAGGLMRWSLIANHKGHVRAQRERKEERERGRTETDRRG